MSKKDRGEHSRCNEPDESEKPLKKARFLWEVKGKHHLKNNLPNNSIVAQNDHVITKEINDSLENQQMNQKHEENCVEKEACSCNCLQQFLSKSEDIMNNIEDDVNSNQVEDDYELPFSLLGNSQQNEDYYLRRWQARQIARGFVDNTINSVLETWTTRPPDASDFIENCCNDGQVEDDAILMAIQEHGLQSHSKLQKEVDALHTHTNKGSSVSQNIDNSSQIEDNIDFINAAVSAAIAKKGLSYGF